mgnify:FL=1
MTDRLNNGRPPVPQGFSTASVPGGTTPAPAPAGSDAFAPGAPTSSGAPLPSQPPQVPTRRPPARFDERDWPTLVLSVLLSLFWCVASDGPKISLAFILFGGIGFSISMLAFFACALSLRGGLKGLGPYTIFLLVVVMGLACIPSVTTNPSVRFLNAFVLAAASMLEYLLLTGCAESVALSLGGACLALATFVREQGRNIRVLRTLRRGSKGERSVLAAVLRGLLAAALILAFVLPLLASADEGFASALRGLLGWLDDGWVVYRIVRLALIGALTFSLLYGVAHVHGRGSSTRPASGRPASAVTVGTMLAVLDLLYLMFVAIQFGRLFGGPSIVAGDQAYAGYAREGFFQLVIVAGVNIVVAFLSVRARRGAPRSATLIALQYVLLFTILVMLASAALRMGAYVGCYGLTMLRALTYVGMLAILSLTVLVAVWVIRPGLKVFRWSVAALLVIWLAFGLSSPAERIAQYNVDGYLSGSIERIDVVYLVSLGPDSSYAVERLLDEKPSLRQEVMEMWHYGDTGYGDAREGYGGMSSQRDWAERSLRELVS